MHERFDDVSRAVSYVASGVRSDFPGRTFEVTVERRGSTMCYTCTPLELTRVLLDACRRFPLASVHYNAEQAEGPIAEIHCHCRGEKAPSCCRYSHPRSQVILSVVPEPVLSGSAGREG